MKDITYKKEDLFFSPYAMKSADTKGRVVYEKPCEMRTDFQRDRDRVIHSKAFRRLKNKTQVFISTEGDHFRTRLTHTLDVSQIARSIARCLCLNEDLCEAIALGHDLGHTPFGHAGERTLDRLCEGGFEHNRQSLRVVDVLENDGAGLNLTFEVRDGILNHKKALNPCTLEGRAVSVSDRIAYVNHDIDDSLRSGVITEKTLPEKEIKILGNTSSKRINTLILSIYENSKGKNLLELGKTEKDALENLRDFMFEKVYFRENAKLEEEKSDRMIELLFKYYKNNLNKLPSLYTKLLENCSVDTVVCDYISGMSDGYAVFVFESLFIPKKTVFK